jgi:Photoprotection regulator fluorescence recovery protein
MTVSDIEWSKKEQELAQKVFKKAYLRETGALIEEVRQRAGAIAELDQIWRLHDFLSARRHDLDGKYDDRYSGLLFVFSRLIKEGWLNLEELEGLDTDKLTKVAALARM